MGTPDFASVVLEHIIAAGHEVVGVISQPDKKQGRGQKIVPTHHLQKMTLRHNESWHT